MSSYYVYMLTNAHRNVLYTGVTNCIQRRLNEHLENSSGFVYKYNAYILVFAQEFASSLEAIEREKQLKGWTRKKKNMLINKLNPTWKDLLNEKE